MRRPRKISIAALAAALLLCAGCYNGPGFPAMTLAKFVRASSADDDTGLVGVSTGLAIVDQPEGSYAGLGSGGFYGDLFSFPFEGALSLWLAEYYDLSLSVNSSAMLTLEGSLGVDLGGVRVALLHGAGVGMWNQISGPDLGHPQGTLHYGFSGGLMIQTTGWQSGTLFFGSRYTYAEIEDLNDPHTIEDWARTHSVTGSLGFTFTAGFLRITPEFILSYSYRHIGDTSESDYDGSVWLIIPTVNLAASF